MLNFLIISIYLGTCDMCWFWNILSVLLSSATFSLFRVVLERQSAPHRVCVDRTHSANAAHNFINHCKRFFWGEWPGSGERERKKRLFLFFLSALFLSQSSAPSQILILLAHFICEELYRLAWLVFFCFFAGTQLQHPSLSLFRVLSLSRRVINLRTASRKHPTWRPPFADSLPGALAGWERERPGEREML